MPRESDAMRIFSRQAGGILYRHAIFMSSSHQSCRPLSKQDYVTLASFRYALRCFLRFSEDAATEAGLSTQQHQALLAIRGFPGRDSITVGELAERLQVRHHSAVGLIDRLVSCQLVEREPNSEDRRSVLIRLTETGERTLETLTKAHREELRRTGPKLRGLLQTLVENTLADNR